MSTVLSSEPVSLELICNMFDPVAHYLGHKIDDVLTGERLTALDGPPEMVHVALHSVCDALSSIIELVEQGKLALVANHDDQGFTSYGLVIVGLN